jgi:hypothetical protein
MMITSDNIHGYSLCNVDFPVLTEKNLRSFLDQLTSNQDDFFAIEMWKKAGYIGAESPESYDCKTEFDMGDEMMLCLFPNQDKMCFDSGWLK